MLRFAAAATLIVGCTNLPTIEDQECGNAVIEAPEACDTFSTIPGSVCRPKGSVGECRLDCRVGSDGKRPACPSGWGCDSDDLCRAPSGDFDSPVTTELGGAALLASGDFDGDGRDDVFSREPVDAYGRGRLSAHYFDQNGLVSESRAFPKAMTAPFITDISGDRRADLVFSDFRVGVLQGRSDRSWLPETFTSYVVPGSRVRMVGVVEIGVVESETGLVALATVDGTHGVYIPDPESGVLTLESEMSGSVEELAGETPTGPLFDGPDSPCMELVLAFRGAENFAVHDLCKLDTTVGLPAWRRPSLEQTVGFEPPATIDDRSPLIADLNGDGHQDVLISASGTTYVAYGDGERLAIAEPFLLHNANEKDFPPAIPMPLAAGEFSGDNLPDFVFPGFLLASSGGELDGQPTYVVTAVNAGAPWTVARIADLNANGISDIVAASSAAPSVDFFNSTGALYTLGSRLTSNNPIDQLVVGDIDGDLIRDVAFIEAASADQERQTLWVAWGRPAGAPETPAEVARLTSAEELGAFPDGASSGLIVTSSSVVDGQRNGGITVLEGGPDRLPLASHTLVSFAYDGSLLGSIGAGVTVGAFTAANRHDVFALGAPEDTGAFDFWLIPSIDEGVSTPVRLEGTPDSRLTATTVHDDGTAQLSNAGTVADFDADGLDEAVWAMPADAGKHCGLSWLNPALETRELVVRGFVLLDEPCADPELAAVDADGDGWVDVAILTGATGAAERRLLVLWNDGSGGFSADGLTQLNDASDAPQAFTVLPAGPARPLALAYVTAGELKLSLQSSDPRFFEVSAPLLELARGTGIVAADANGDGVSDLVVADAGNLRLLKAALVPE